MTLLVVDDEPECWTLLTAVLTAEGYELRATNGRELALASMTLRRPELILPDIRIASMDGSRTIPLMFLSASESSAKA